MFDVDLPAAAEALHAPAERRQSSGLEFLDRVFVAADDHGCFGQAAAVQETQLDDLPLFGRQARQTSFDLGQRDRLVDSAEDRPGGQLGCILERELGLAAAVAEPNRSAWLWAIRKTQAESGAPCG